jgi:translation initiation factor IF-2
MRIHELAKELGVENKVILGKAAELGMSDKTSHSNSLRADEADRIRRAFLRQTVTPSTTANEVLTKRVDKTGATESLVERRVGNVIRRRKQADESPAEEKAPAPLNESLEASEIQPVIEEQPAPLAAKSIEEEIPETAVTEPAAELQVAGKPAEEEPAAKKTAVGPRILGKVELPQKKVVKTEVRRFTNGAAGSTALKEEVEDEEDARKKDVKKKSRKREISRIDLVDYEGREDRRAFKAGKGKSRSDRDDPHKSSQTEITKPKQSKRVVKMDEMITVGELAKQMSLKSGQVIAKLMELGIMATINQSVDADTATIIAEEFEFQIERTGFDETEVLEDVLTKDSDENLKPRPPVVTVMGHVDHGKTSLLDAIRKTTVVKHEHGGITQHIGAYSVKLAEGKEITFVDTPGHAAFTAMRARGAQVTDIVILVVAADDGVMPQTLEALNHAKAAKVPVVVAVNKIDKVDSKPDRIKQQLAEHGLNPEEWGGDTMYYPVSALKGTGLKELLEGVLLQAEVKELKANPDKRAKGTIIEAKQDKGRGTVATVLIQGGTLRIGDMFVTGANYGRVRSMVDFDGNKVTEAGPSLPVEITGINGVPEAGDDFFVVEDEANARQVSQTRVDKLAHEERSLAGGPISLEEFARRANNLAAAELNVILKADVAGSVGAVKESLEKLSTPKVKVRVLHAAVGGINESDVQLATASKAVIVGFGVRAEPRAVTEAEKAGIEIRFYRIIYELIDDIKKAMVGLLDPIKTEMPMGRVEVRETFNVSKVGTIAGCYVQEGMVKRTSNIRVVRDSKVIYEGKLASLKRFKDDAREVQAGYECGLSVDRFNDIKVGDILEVYEIRESEASLED